MWLQTSLGLLNLSATEAITLSMHSNEIREGDRIYICECVANVCCVTEDGTHCITPDLSLDQALQVLAKIGDAIKDGKTNILNVSELLKEIGGNTNDNQ